MKVTPLWPLGDEASFLEGGRFFPSHPVLLMAVLICFPGLRGHCSGPEDHSAGHTSPLVGGWGGRTSEEQGWGHTLPENNTEFLSPKESLFSTDNYISSPQAGGSVADGLKLLPPRCPLSLSSGLGQAQRGPGTCRSRGLSPPGQPTQPRRRCAG